MLLSLLVFSLFFLVAIFASTLAYSKVIIAQQEMSLEEPSRSAAVLENGSLELRFAVRLENPGEFPLHVMSTSWYVQVTNQSGSPAIITLARVLFTGTGEIVVAEGLNRSFEFVGIVNGETLSELKGFLNYSNSQGADYTLETGPYIHRFEVRGWLDDFKHDYLREDYLNKLVMFDLVYDYPEAGQ